MESGIVSLESLYAFAQEHKELEALNGRSSAGRAYRGCVEKVVASIAATQGFYLWGCYETNGLWRNIYLGRAGFGKTTHLRSRITEELMDERCCLWRTVFNQQELFAVGARLYPSMWNKYEQHWRRSLRKVGATHVTWVSDSSLSNADVANIESDLIETLNPFGNVSRPVPPVTLRGHTYEVIRHVRFAIHHERERKYALTFNEPVERNDTPGDVKLLV